MTILEQLDAAYAKDVAAAAKLVAIRAALPDGVTLRQQTGRAQLVKGTTEIPVNIAQLAEELGVV